jgi:hypothetical protein
MKSALGIVAYLVMLCASGESPGARPCKPGEIRVMVFHLMSVDLRLCHSIAVARCQPCTENACAVVTQCQLFSSVQRATIVPAVPLLGQHIAASSPVSLVCFLLLAAWLVAAVDGADVLMRVGAPTYLTRCLPVSSILHDSTSTRRHTLGALIHCWHGCGMTWFWARGGVGRCQCDVMQTQVTIEPSESNRPLEPPDSMHDPLTAT